MPKLMRYACTPTCGAHLTKFIQVYPNGPRTQNHSPYRAAMENVRHWYDGRVSSCTEPTDSTAFRPVGDNSLADQLSTLVLDVAQPVNIRQNNAGLQDSEGVPHSYAPQYLKPPYTNPSKCTHIFGNPASPCSTITSPITSIAWGDSVPSPTPHGQHHSHSDDTISGTGLQLNIPPHPGSPSVSAAPSPTPHGHRQQLEHSDDAISESQLPLALPSYPAPEVPMPTPPPGPSFLTLDSTPPQDLIGRRALAPVPKRGRIARAVQPLACYFCRGRKIACGPPTNHRSGDQICEYVVLTHSLKTLFCVFDFLFFGSLQ